MGMFDYVHLEVPLPDGSDNRREFQTKAFEQPFMEHYTITSDGRLMYDPTELVPDEERPHYGTPEWDKGGLYQVMGMLRRAPEKRAEVEPPYHGDIDLIAPDFKEYVARFTNGRLESIIALPDRYSKAPPPEPPKTGFRENET